MRCCAPRRRVSRARGCSFRGRRNPTTLWRHHSVLRGSPQSRPWSRPGTMWRRRAACLAATYCGTVRPFPSRSSRMANVAVIGAQWGDEGKGKVVDWLASRADIVVRFQGGHNAGHTLVVGNQTYKLSLLPSGLVRGKLGIIGNGVVIDQEALLTEIDRVRAQGLAIGPEEL